MSVYRLYPTSDVPVMKYQVVNAGGNEKDDARAGATVATENLNKAHTNARGLTTRRYTSNRPIGIAINIIKAFSGNHHAVIRWIHCSNGFQHISDNYTEFPRGNSR